MKKLLSVLLSLLLLAPACAGAVTTADYERYAEPISVTVGKEFIASPGFADESHTQAKNNMVDLIRDVYNINVELAWESDEYNSKLALSVAAGDLPDIFVVRDKLLYSQLVENGMLADLSDAYEKYASDYVRTVNESYDNQTLLTDSEGHLYGIGSGNYYYGSHEHLWLRQDWLDALGMKAPSTLEELEQVLIAFRDKYNSKGLLIAGDDPFGGVGALYSAFPIAAANGAYPSTWIEGKDGKALYGSVMPGMKDTLELMARWYKEGLIDYEFATRTIDERGALFAAGESGSAFGPWSLGYFITDLRLNPEAKLCVLNAPVNANGEFRMLRAMPYANILCVSAKCAHPEAMIKMLSLEFDAYLGFYADGFERIAADVQNNVSWNALFPTGNMNLVNANRMLEYAECVRERVEDGGWANPSQYSASMQTNANAVADFVAGDTQNANGWIGYYGRVIAAKQFTAENAVPICQVFDGTTESMSDLWASMKSLEQQTFLSIIVGQSPVDSFDTFVAQWYNQGGDVITAEVNAVLGK